MQKIDNQLIEEILKKARASPRKRALHCLHKPDSNIQIMINACLQDTYVTPHKHENPDKKEIFCVLRGKGAIIIFDDSGKIKEKTILEEGGTVKAAVIPPRTWHSLVILSPEAVFFELLEGRYDPQTHKQFAPWAPTEENKEEAKKYLQKLKEQIRGLKNEMRDM